MRCGILSGWMENVWLWQLAAGISVLSITDRSVIQSYYEADGLSENRTRSLVRMSDGSIWAATRDGITILKDGELSYLNVADGLIHPRVTRLMEDGKGGVWIGTEGGLSHYYEGRISNFTDANGLSKQYYHQSDA